MDPQSNHLSPPHATEQAYRLIYFGEYERAEELCQPFIDLAEEQVNTRAAVLDCVAALAVMGRICCETGPIIDAYAYLYRALELLDRHNDPGLRCRVLNALSAAYFFDMKTTLALDLGKQSSELAEECGLPFELADACNTLCAITQDLDYLNDATEYANRAIQATLESNFDSLSVISLGNLAILKIRSGEFDLAVRMLTEALALAKGAGNAYQAAVCQSLLGVLKLSSGNFTDAEGQLADAIGQLRQYRFHFRIANLSYLLGIAQMRLGKMAEAEGTLLAAAQLATANDLQVFQFAIQNALAEYYEGVGKPDKALEHLKLHHAFEKLRKMQTGNRPYSQLSLKYPPEDLEGSIERFDSLQKFRTLEPGTNFLNYLTFLEIGREMFRKNIENGKPLFGIALTIRSGSASTDYGPLHLGVDELDGVNRILNRHIRLTDLCCMLPAGQILILLANVDAGKAELISQQIHNALNEGRPDGNEVMAFRDHALCLTATNEADLSLTHFVNRTLLELVDRS